MVTPALVSLEKHSQFLLPSLHSLGIKGTGKWKILICYMGPEQDFSNGCFVLMNSLSLNHLGSWIKMDIFLFFSKGLLNENLKLRPGMYILTIFLVDSCIRWLRNHCS